MLEIFISLAVVIIEVWFLTIVLKSYSFFTDKYNYTGGNREDNVWTYSFPSLFFASVIFPLLCTCTISSLHCTYPSLEQLLIFFIFLGFKSSSFYHIPISTVILFSNVILIYKLKTPTEDKTSRIIWGKWERGKKFRETRERKGEMRQNKRERDKYDDRNFFSVILMVRF